jgi:hypothetical protein
MHKNATSQEKYSAKGGGFVKGLIVLLSAYVLLLSGGLGIARLHNIVLPLLVRSAIESHASFLQAAAAGGLAGLVSLAVFQRKRSVRKTLPAVIRSRPMVFEEPEIVHPLFQTPRQSRDKKFIIRKTRKRGKMHRNRGGEKIPVPP